MQQVLHRRAHLIGALVALALISVLVLRTSSAAFTATTTNDDNSFATSEFTLTGAEAGGTLFTVTDMLPSDSDTGCVEVTYDGATHKLSEVKVFSSGPVGGDAALAAELQVTIEQGAAGSDCGSFTAEDTSTAKSVTAFAADTTPAAGFGTWTPSDGDMTRAFRVTVELPFAATEAVKNMTVDDLGFTWQIESTEG